MYLPDEKSIVGRNLQILINQKNWSIKQAAKELNYDRINLSKMLSGSQNFRIKTLVKFAHFFDVPVFLLFNRLFEDEQYRKDFSFVDEDYMHVFRVNFKATSVKQSLIDLDSTTVSHIINGRRNNPNFHLFSLRFSIGSHDWPLIFIQNLFFLHFLIWCRCNDCNSFFPFHDLSTHGLPVFVTGNKRSIRSLHGNQHCIIKRIIVKLCHGFKKFLIAVTCKKFFHTGFQ